MEPIEITYAQEIDRPAPEVWAALSRLEGLAMPDYVEAKTIPQDNTKLQKIHLSDKISMEQQLVECRDDIMLMRFEMTRGDGVLWTSYQARFMVEPAGASQCRIRVQCTAMPTMEPRAVEDLLRSTLFLGISRLKSTLEKPSQAQ